MAIIANEVPKSASESLIATKTIAVPRAFCWMELETLRISREVISSGFKIASTRTSVVGRVLPAFGR
jgi:hypothetical protein